MSVTAHYGTDPLWCEEYGYGLGRPDGIFVLKYRSAGTLEFGESRQDFLHQLYWSPDALLSTSHGLNTQFVGPSEAFWVQRAVSHEVRAADEGTVYRVCLREVPGSLDGVRAGAASIDDEAGRLLRTIARPGHDEDRALAARARILAGLGGSTREFVGHHATGSGHAMTVARAMAHDPGDPTALSEWAARLHISVKTLQRDFDREFGMPYSRWRTELRLRAARALVQTQPVTAVARRVGYASTSAFVAAFAARFGHTPRRRGRGRLS
ncbi:AraC family transcriptional regulator [Haloactinopolyspora alba]|uniref:AraC family transcriptional regulator n=1 Tax=Haloactinopolyspora alba TaxID=648780 RepID=A0A2P8EC59_9ACTN|nr:AraC family transcriptional regulator [Haloactinopolyspora alba]PSL07030.1 AraC family transcriptional regulator [Haloactinopolyspora alba]